MSGDAAASFTEKARILKFMARELVGISHRFVCGVAATSERCGHGQKRRL